MYRRREKSSSFFPNRGGAVVEHCRKYTVGYGAWRDSRPGHRPWPCGDRAGVLAAPAGGVAVPVESTVPRVRRGSAPRVLHAGVLPWSRSGPLPRAVPMPFEGSAEGNYKGSTGILQHSGWSSAEHVSHSVAGSHSVATAPGMA